LLAALAASSPAAGADLWTAVARAPGDAAARALRAADEAAAGRARQAGAGRPAEGDVEARLREALRWAPESFEVWRQLADLLSAAGRSREAIAAEEAARRVAPTPRDEARGWFRIGFEKSRLGLYAEALAAYERQIALGDLDADAAGNSGELLMALGRLDEAIERYREAVAIEERASDRRGRTQALALAYFGLAVALDRAERPAASREAVGRAVALDPGLSVLQLALIGSEGISFVPPGDVYYYLGLGREALGKLEEARAAFREYLARAGATDRYAERARDHLAELRPDGPPGGAGGPGAREAGRTAAPPSAGAPRPKLRLVAEATVETDGPVVAPLIDAAWRLEPSLLDTCLEGASSPDGPRREPGAEPRLRMSVEIEIDDRGRVRKAAARLPEGLDAAFGRCVEEAIGKKLRFPRPAVRKPTRARIELLLAPRPAGAGGL
jgi:tetratricopeptide (TPR) repeat protein